MPVAEKLVRLVGRTPRRGPIPAGKARLDANLVRWDQPSNRQPFLVLRDWDDDDGVACVPGLIDKVRGDGPGSRVLAVRIAVRSVESWLLADSEAFSSFFRVRRNTLPPSPDELVDPKGAVLELRRVAGVRARYEWACCRGTDQAVVLAPNTQRSLSSSVGIIGTRRRPAQARRACTGRSCVWKLSSPTPSGESGQTPLTSS